MVPISSSSTNWDWLSTNSIYNHIDGTGLVFSSGAPTAGTITGFGLDLDTNLTDGYELAITGLSLDATLFAPLVGSSLSPDQKNDLYWRTLLAGDDTIHLGSTGHTITFAGDGRNVEDGDSLFGGADSIDGTSADPLSFNGDVSGDYLKVESGGIAAGGNDTINATAYIIEGDAHLVEGSALLRGGNDTLQSPDAYYIIGDADFVNGTLIGGNDTIDAANANEAYGDAFQLVSGGLLIGGNDSIDGGSEDRSQILVGDLDYVVGGTAQGGNDTISGGGGGDYIYGDFYSVTGGTAHGGNDLLYGNAGNDTIYGNGGDDTIDGGAGTDALHGEDGNDTFHINDETFVVGAETMDGGNGTDTIFLTQDGSSYSFDLSSASLTSIEAIRFDDVFSSVGTASAQLKSSQFGVGLSLTAAITGSTFSFVVDTLIVAMDTTSRDLSGLVFTNFSGPGDHVVIDGHSASSALTITGTDVNDSILGGSASDNLTGGDGNDTISGGAGVDSLYGGAGNDLMTYVAGQAYDNYYGGADVDTVVFQSFFGDALQVDLGLGHYNAGGPVFDIVDVENIVTGDGNDTLTGNNEDNRLDGGGGNDDLHTSAANIASGEAYDGGAGTSDTLFIDSAAPLGSYTADLRGVQLTGLEGLAFDDSGSGGVATIQVLASQIGTGLSASTLLTSNIDNFGDTTEILEVTIGTATSLNLSQLTFDAFWGNNPDRVVVLGGTVAANIIGSQVNDSITGSSLNDTIRGGLGNDTLDGGAGAGDTLDYSDRSQTISLTLGVASVTVGGVAEDTISNFENVIGGTGNDTIFGDGGGNTIIGGGGSDFLYGEGGNDRLVASSADNQGLVGGAGRDTLVGGAGNNDNLFVQDGDDTAGGGESYDGGGLVDWLIIDGVDGAYSIDLRDDTLLHLENLDVGDSGGAAVGRTGTVKLTAAQFAQFSLISGSAETNAANVLDLTMGSVTTLNLTGKTFDATMAGIRDKVVINGDTDAENITGSSVRDSILGGGGNDTLIGGAGTDTLTGGSLSDSLVGGTGADILIGGSGDDRFFVLPSEDASGEEYHGDFGTDRIVMSAVNGTTVTGAATVDFRNDTFDSISELDFATDAGHATTATAKLNAHQIAAIGTIAGIGAFVGSTDANDSDILELTMGTVTGLDLSSTTFTNFTGSGDKVVILGDSDAEAITGSAVKDSIVGGDGNDTIKGGLGNDSLNGGNNTDTADYSDKSIKVTISLNASGNGSAVMTGETDTLTGFENLTGGSAGDALTGNASANAINGMAGVDTMTGGDGSDTYTADLTTDVVTETNAAAAGGNDLVNFIGTSGTFTLGANIERLTLGGSSTINGTGNGLANTITGNGAANILNGAGGIDVLIGGGGNDTYIVDTLTDTITEAAGTTAGTADLVKFTGTAGQTFTLAANVENLTLLGAAATNGTGNSSANTIVGNTGANILNGMTGNDTMTGNAGADSFLFNTALGATNIDTITDMTHGTDKIQLENAIFTALGAGPFVTAQFLAATSGHTATTTSQHIIYDKSNGTLWYDSDGSTGGAANAVEFAQLGTSATHPTNIDFTDFQIV